MRTLLAAIALLALAGCAHRAPKEGDEAPPKQTAQSGPSFWRKMQRGLAPKPKAHCESRTVGDTVYTDCY